MAKNPTFAGWFYCKGRKSTFCTKPAGKIMQHDGLRIKKVRV
jgi:hypothetical protein